MGTMSAIVVALSLDTSKIPAGLVWILAFLTAAVAGALWGCIPGFFKAFLNVNEVITSIMTNWIAANIATWIFTLNICSGLISKENTKGAYLIKNVSNFTPKLGLDKIFTGSYIDGGIFIAIIVAIVIFIILNKTTFGYELKACGANRHASR